MTNNPDIRHKTFYATEFIMVSILLFPVFYIFRAAICGDAAIYFTFIKNFFSLPFSFQPETVSFGATSPLYVVIHASIYSIFQDSWLSAGKFINYQMIAIGIVFLNKANYNNIVSLLILALLGLTAYPLLIASSRFYESGLVFLMISLVYYFLKQRYHKTTILLAGLLYLVRPELVLITIAVDIYILITSKRPLRCLTYIVLSSLPALLYHAYMLHNTGQLIPSSVLARNLRAIEDPMPWSQRIIACISTLIGPMGLTYIFGSISLAILFLRKPSRYLEELILFIPVPLLYFIMPPNPGYFARYLLPIMPIVIVCASRLVTWIWFSILPAFIIRTYPSAINIQKTLDRTLVFALTSLTIMIILIYGLFHPNRFDIDTFLLKDLAYQINPYLHQEDKIVIYEIQSQYYITGFCISLDCIVGHHMLPVYKGDESVADYLNRENIRYVVTMNSFNYRRAFKDTLLVDLYTHDLNSQIGDTTILDGIKFHKIITNSNFSDPQYYQKLPQNNLNTNDYLRVYNDSNPLWRNHSPMWNSVYEVFYNNELAR